MESTPASTTAHARSTSPIGEDLPPRPVVRVDPFATNPRLQSLAAGVTVVGCIGRGRSPLERRLAK